jgi:two-component system, NtrC family, response regulator AtoC
MRTACFLGDTPAVQQVRRILVKVADAPFPVLIEGETGSGKYEAALLLHERSRRAQQPFAEIHCANLTETLFESTLFGHERGAFPDAHDRQTGRIELADRGTILFDEIDCLSNVCQAKLLRLVDRGSYERVGGRTTFTTSARMVFACNQSVLNLVQKGELRSDLFERIGWLIVRIPPLRERVHDIPLLASLFLEEAHVSYNLARLRWSNDALTTLARHTWPGNIRELKSFAHVAAYLFADQEVIRGTHVESLLASRTPNPATRNDAAASMTARRANLERQVIVEALRHTSGNRVHAARLLNISRRSLQTKISKYGI